MVNKLKSLPETSIVLLISVSPTLLRIGSNIAAAIRGESISVKALLADDTKEITYMMQYAKVVICDLPSKDKVLSLAKKVPVQVFNLYSPATIELIKDSLQK